MLIERILTTIFVASSIEAFTSSPHHPVSGALKLSQEKAMGMQMKPNREKNIDWNDVSDSDSLRSSKKGNKDNFPNRREALVATAASILGTSVYPGKAEAVNLPFEVPFATATSKAASGYQQAKRATAYLVDSTLPPTLVPFRAVREAAILKQIGSGIGTQKTPFLEESVNLNNFMKKSVFGTIDAVASIANPSALQKKGPTFCFLALPELTNDNEISSDDTDLAKSIMVDLLKPRRSSLNTDTSMGLSFIPKTSGQPILDKYIQDGNEESLMQKMTAEAQVAPQTVTNLLPLLRFAKQKGVPLLALGPEIQDLVTVRREGLQNVNLDRRSQYVIDTDGFINLTLDKKFKLYADRSLLKDWKQINGPDDGTTTQSSNTKQDSPGDFFAQRILEDEAIATSIAQWAVSRPDSFMIVISDIPHSRFFGGANGRVPRVLKYLDKDSPVDEESVTTILLNPTAENTLSLSRFLRLEIGTSPDNWDVQTKIADYLWFSSAPKVNMLPRLMRGY